MWAIPPTPPIPAARWSTPSDSARRRTGIRTRCWSAAAPSPARRPGIGGALQVGSTLTVVDGDWDPADATLTHQWLRNDVPVLGATGPTYLLTTADLGKGIRVKTTAAAPSYAKTTLQSAKTAPVTNAGGAVPSLVAGYVGIGTSSTNPDRPSRLVYGGGTFKGAPVIHCQYQWLRDGKPIPGATARNVRPDGLGSDGAAQRQGHRPRSRVQAGHRDL